MCGSMEELANGKVHCKLCSRLVAKYAASGVATGMRGCGPHQAALARGSKGVKNAEIFKNSSENSDCCKFHMCLRARKTKHYSQRVPIVSY